MPLSCNSLELTSTKQEHATQNDDTAHEKFAQREHILHLHVQPDAHEVDESHETCWNEIVELHSREKQWDLRTQKVQLQHREKWMGGKI
jgi:hypothetical protein